MKAAVLIGAKIGAVVGFASSLGYSVLVIVLSELYLPPDGPSKIAVLKQGTFYLPILTGISFYAMALSSLIGAMMGLCFAIISKQFRLARNAYVCVCTLASVAVIIPLYGLPTWRWISSPYVATRGFVLFPSTFPEIVLMVLCPSLVFVLAGGIVSSYLYHRLVLAPHVESSEA